MCNVNGLQKICDVLSEHQSWTVAHLAAYFALYDSFDNAKINCYLNSSDNEKGMSPLQVAITTHNLKTVQILAGANCSLEHLDWDGNSVFHYAASTTKEIIAVRRKSLFFKLTTHDVSHLGADARVSSQMSEFEKSERLYTLAHGLPG